MKGRYKSYKELVQVWARVLACGVQEVKFKFPFWRLGYLTSIPKLLRN